MNSSVFLPKRDDWTAVGIICYGCKNCEVCAPGDSVVRRAFEVENPCEVYKALEKAIKESKV